MESKGLKPTFILYRMDLWPEESLTFGLICPLGMPGILGPSKSTHKYSPVLTSAPLVCPLYSSLAPRQHHPSPSAPTTDPSFPRQQPCYPDEGSVALIIISSMASATSSPCISRALVPPLETLQPNLNLAPISLSTAHFGIFSIQTLTHITS